MILDAIKTAFTRKDSGTQEVTEYIPKLTTNKGQDTLSKLTRAIGWNRQVDISKHTFDLLDFTDRAGYIKWVSVWKDEYKALSQLQREDKRKIRRSSGLRQNYTDSEISRIQGQIAGRRCTLHGLCRLRTSAKSLSNQLRLAQLAQ